MPKKLIAVTIVRTSVNGIRIDTLPGGEIPEGLDAETIDELKRLGAVREEVVEALAPEPLPPDEPAADAPAEAEAAAGKHARGKK